MQYNHMPTIRGDSYQLRAKRKAGLIKPNRSSESKGQFLVSLNRRPVRFANCYLSSSRQLITREG